jgi:hypothetical protein
MWKIDDCNRLRERNIVTCSQERLNPNLAAQAVCNLAGSRGKRPMNSCVVSGLTGEADDRQISGYLNGHNKGKE